MFSGDILRNWDLSLVVIARHDLRRIVPQLLLAKRPAKSPIKPNRQTTQIQKEKTNVEFDEHYLQRRRTWTLTPFSFSWRLDIFELARLVVVSKICCKWQISKTTQLCVVCGKWEAKSGAGWIWRGNLKFWGGAHSLSLWLSLSLSRCRIYIQKSI